MRNGLLSYDNSQLGIVSHMVKTNSKRQEYQERELPLTYRTPLLCYSNIIIHTLERLIKWLSEQPLCYDCTWWSIKADLIQRTGPLGR